MTARCALPLLLFAAAGDSGRTSLTLLYTHTAAGYLQSCGCAGTAAVGLAEAVGLVRAARREVGDRLLAVDGGDLAPEAGSGAVVWSALARAGYDVVAFGPSEAGWEPDYRRLVAAQPLPVLGLRSLDGAPTVYDRIVERAGRRVAVVSLGPSYEPPVEQIERIRARLRKLRGEVDLVVLLTHRTVEAERRAMGEAWAGLVDLVIGARGSERLREPERVGRGWLLPAAQTGRRVGLVEVRWTDEGVGIDWRAEAITARQPTDAEVARQVAAYLEAQQQAFLVDGVEDDPAVLAADGYVPPSACVDCHAEADARWRAGAHARAVATLAARKALRPECLACHSEAFRATGFIAPPDLPQRGIECVTCHAGARRHLEEPRAGTIERGGLGDCVRCHNEVHDPAWKADERWAVVRH